MTNKEPIWFGMATDLADFRRAYAKNRAKDRIGAGSDEIALVMRIYGDYLIAMMTATVAGTSQIAQMATLGPPAEPEPSPHTINDTNDTQIHHLMPLAEGGKVLVSQDRKNPDTLTFHVIAEDRNGRTHESKFSIVKGKEDWKP